MGSSVITCRERMGKGRWVQHSVAGSLWGDCGMVGWNPFVRLVLAGIQENRQQRFPEMGKNSQIPSFICLRWHLEGPSIWSIHPRQDIHPFSQGFFPDRPELGWVWDAGPPNPAFPSQRSRGGTERSRSRWWPRRWNCSSFPRECSSFPRFWAKPTTFAFKWSFGRLEMLDFPSGEA